MHRHRDIQRQKKRKKEEKVLGREGERKNNDIWRGSEKSEMCRYCKKDRDRMKDKVKSKREKKRQNKELKSQE